MTTCYDEGMLRAYLDNELPVAERDAVAAHLAACGGCQSTYDELRVQSAQLKTMLAEQVALPDVQTALNRMKESTGRTNGRVQEPLAALATHDEWRKHMSNKNNWLSGGYRKLFAGLAVLVVMITLLALPPVRALADQLLQVFRVQEVMFVPVSSERMEQLENLDMDGKSLFMAEPEVINEPGEPQEVASAAEAADVVGYAVKAPAVFPSAPISTSMAVKDRATLKFQVNVETSQQLLAMMDINDVTIPEALGDEPIMVDVPSSVQAQYAGEDYELMLFQGRSPEVTMPEGVDMSTLGKAALRLLGVEANQAEALSQEVDWSSTLIVPFPSDLETIRQVTVGDAKGLLTHSGHYHDGKMYKQLYWQSGDHFYVLMSEGRISNDEIIAAANSVQ